MFVDKEEKACFTFFEADTVLVHYGVHPTLRTVEAQTWKSILCSSAYRIIRDYSLEYVACSISLFGRARKLIILLSSHK